MEGARAPSPAQRGRVGEGALSQGQRGLWFLHRLAPDGTAYHLAAAARVHGDISGDTLHAAFQTLADRHEALRTTYAAGLDGEPVAVFHPALPVAFSEHGAEARLSEIVFRPFDLENGPLLRLDLFGRPAAGGHRVLAVSVHHIAADFWSFGVLIRELGALLEGKTLPPPAARYTDFARRQEQMLESPAGERLWDHWRERLAGTPQLDLPTDRPRRPVTTLRGGSRSLPVSSERTEAVRRLAAAHGCTPFVALLAAWQAVLSRWSGQEEFLTGAPFAGRSAREWAEVVGYFVNLVPLRAHLSGDPTVGELMARTRRTALDALAHQDFPFALLTERLQPERDPSRPPLVAAMLTFEKAPAQELAALAAFAVGETGVRLELGGLVLEPLSLAPPAAQLDLALTAAELGNGLAVSLQWDAGLFDESTAGRMLGHLDRLLTGMATGADLRIAELPLLAVEERDQILLAWSGAESGPPAGTGCLHELFEAQAARTPDATALVVGEERWTYDYLNRRANRLAHHLRRLGAGPEQRVGVLMSRSGDLIAALLGILKAGAAYVPLDPAYPEEWLAFAAQDAEVALLLTEERYAGKLPGRREIPARGEAIAREPEENPEPLAGPGNLAYVMYTSGSTGRPKGVALEHRAPVERMLWARAAFPAEDLAGVLAATSICFDLSVFEIFAPLSWGGTVILADNALALPGLSARGEVTLVNTVPSAMSELAAGELPPALRTVNLAGEALAPQLAERIYRHAQVEHVFNLYGPTEDATYSTGTRVERGAERVSIGRPLPGTRAYVLDRRLQPVPGGVPGELFLAGAGGARGYLNRPDLTAERFIPDPFGTQAGGRLYRTGDLARWLASGELEHLGRLDHQVKVRGFRIELGEIEAALLTHPEVRQTVAVVRESTGGKILVAYVAGEELTAADLREHLRRRLPEHMIPASFVFLPALPLTPNGKVDRKALPPTSAAPEWEPAEERYLAPRTPVEEILAGIWAEVLGRERVGATDHFFELGGHSLLATRVVSRLRGTLGIEVPLRDLFAAPRLADFAARVEAARQTATAPSAPPLRAVPREGAVPLSFAQQRLWFIDQLEPGSPLYNMSGALWAEGPLDGAVLALCLGEVVRRHEALRTVFAAPEGSPVPVQVIQSAKPFLLPVVDLSALPERAREDLARALAAAEAGRRFDLSRGPLLRGLLLRLAEGDHAVVLTVHHIASDGWSLGILVREIAALYPAHATNIAGRPSPLPELPVQYADFALWQSSWLRGEVLEREIAFWRRQLAGLPPLLELPTDRPRPAVQSYRGAARPVRLPAELTRQMEALARREGATLFMVLLAGFQTLLARYSGQDDFAVGSPVAGRNRVETEGLIGFFVNTLVLRANVTGHPTFFELLGRVRETALAAYLHQDVPFEKLVEELAPERSLAHAPLFQVVLVLQNAPVASLEITDLHLRPMDVNATSETGAKFDLTINLEERDGGLAGVVEYASDLFDATTIDRLIAGFERLLAAMPAMPATMAGPDPRAAELPLLDTVERHQLLVEWGGVRIGEGLAIVGRAEGTLHSRFAARARQVPEAPAVTCGDVTLSYGELLRRSHQLAHWLRRHGAGPESRVGLCLDRSADLVVGILGVLTAGAAYVPLDPDSPRERQDFIVADAGIRIVVTSEEVAALESLPDGDLAPLADESSLAYVIYTSGSTGRPKGVLVTHGNVARLFDATEEWFRFDGRDVWTLFHSYAFDFSVWEIWGALLHGGRLVIVPWEVSRAPELFLDLLARERVTVLNQTPSAFAQLAKAEEQRGAVATDLRLVIFGGEALDPASLEPWFTRHGDTQPRLVNMYGITETTVHVTYRPLSAADARGEHRSVIGRPITDLSLAVMDPSLMPVPIGVPGELVVGGAGLARGYLGRPELTAERFIPDPSGDGSRLYRSGDLGRFLSNGDVEYLGRLDHQVKIRGFRIELGEIEAALTTLPGVHQAVVLMREDQPGDRRLVAYVVGDASVADLRQFLRERLPDYMVPAAFVTLRELPLTVNGKVDRKALPAPEQTGGETGYRAPRTPAEEVLAGIWADLLGFEQVGATDHFFDLGGHSLLATQVTSRLRQAFGVEIPLHDIFEAPVLADLAARIEAARRAGLVVPAPPLLTVPRDGALPLSFAQQRLWFIDRVQPDSPLYNIAAALRIEGPLDAAVLARCLGEVVRRHEALRTVFVAPRGTPVQLIQPPAPVPLPVVDLSGLAPNRRETQALALAGEEAARPFDLSDLDGGPLLRGLLLRLSAAEPAEDHTFALTVHHVASDGWSMGILVREVAALYPAFAAGLPSPLPELPVQYADFSVWQRAWLRGEILEQEIAWWRQQLAGLPPLLELPTDRPRPAVLNHRGATRPVRLPAGLTRQMEALARREGATLFMVLLAGFQILLARTSGQDDLAVGSPVAGRNRVETEGLIGFFVNTLVLRGDLAGTPTFRGLLGRVRETALAAWLHQDVPFEKLIEELAPERSLAHAPLFQVVLALQNAPFGKLEIQDLRLRPVPVAGTTAKFDLTVNFQERDGGLNGTAEYATALYDATTVDRLLASFERLLAEAVTDPELRVAELPLLSSGERHQVLTEWNDTGGEESWEGPVTFLVERWCREQPDAAAAVDAAGRTLTYGALGERSGRLAGFLRSLDLGPESIVAVLMERSAELLVAQLGVLKAGAAYLSLDPAHPAERLAFMLEETAALVVLTQEALLPRLIDRIGRARIVCLDRDGDRQEIALFPPLPALAVAPDHLAYVLYTSGSTGRPKGVQIPHRGLLNLVRWDLRAHGTGPGDHCTQVASLGFDVSVYDIWTCLASGATLHLPPEEARLDPRRLEGWMAERGITVSFLPTPLAEALLAGGGPRIPSLRRLLVGGDRLLLHPEPGCGFDLRNLYGPAEATVATSASTVPPRHRGETGTPTIGRPIDGLRVHLLDRSLQPVPPGVVGELWVGGPALARGYLGDPGRTAERFLPDPWEAGERLYRTGDLCRYRRDGEIELLGRAVPFAISRDLPLTPVPRVAGAPASDGSGAIAIVGLSGRFPGASGVEELWANLCAGTPSIARFSDEELAAAGVPPELRRDPRYVPAAGALDGVELFDAGFFGYSPREAELLDPQQRLFLECAWEALEDAGYDSQRVPGPVGVFASLGFSRYLHQILTAADPAEVGALQLLLSNDKDFLATRISYKLDLAGPSMTVQTACSSSLVAVHLACQNLRLGTCDMALAGGVSINLPQRTGYLYEEGGIASPDGFCRAFDAEARGTVAGSGAGIVVLKRLEDALTQGDTIHAVLLGSAVNNDGGAGKAGYTAPSVAGQAQVISAALAAAGVDPATVSYVEAHGSGTPLGDPIEVAALNLAFGSRTGPGGACLLGSVKSNVGHLDAAAGVTGLIKTVLALEHRQIPPSVHFATPNPAIDFAGGPFRVADRLTDWPADPENTAPRRAGVSAFGIGGTNVHVVLEEAPPAAPSGPSRPWQVLLLSARTPAALERMTDSLADRLEGDPELSLADVAYTLRVGRRPFGHRRAVLAATREEAAAALRERDPQRVWTGGTPETAAGRRNVAFLLPGDGDQYPGLARGLYQDEPVFRQEIDRCAELLAPHLGLDLREVLFATEERETAARALLRETRIAQPAMFAVGYALARLWMSWGAHPAALLGYSLGEYTAACLAGVIELPDALALVARRARLIGELAPGALLAVPMMQPVAGALRDLLRAIPLAPPRIPYLSNVTGTWISAAQAMDPEYWIQHLVSPVRFADGVAELWREPGRESGRESGRILLEMGPGQTLGSLALQQIPAEGAADRAVLSSLRHELDRQPDQRFLLQSLGRLWLSGVEVDWSGFHAGERRRRVSLPAYPFERQRYWIEPITNPNIGIRIGSRMEPDRASPPSPPAIVAGPSLAFVLPEGATMDPAWAAALESRGYRVVGVPPAPTTPEEALTPEWSPLVPIQPSGNERRFKRR